MDSAERYQQIRRVLIYVLLMNWTVAAANLFFGYLMRSASMTAELCDRRWGQKGIARRDGRGGSHGTHGGAGKKIKGGYEISIRPSIRNRVILSLFYSGFFSSVEAAFSFSISCFDLISLTK